MVTCTFATPMNVGSITKPLSVSSVIVTEVSFSSTPQLAPIGTGELDVTLTDPVSGWQEEISYQDASVIDLWNSTPTIAAGTKWGDMIAQTIFAKLIADGNLPASTVATV